MRTAQPGTSRTPANLSMVTGSADVDPAPAARRVRSMVQFDPRQAVFTIPQTIAYLGLSRSMVYVLFGNGKLKGRKILGRTVIDGDELRAFIRDLPTAPIRTKTAA
jgi:hypothetical protein